MSTSLKLRVIKTCTLPLATYDADGQEYKQSQFVAETCGEKNTQDQLKRVNMEHNYRGQNKTNMYHKKNNTPDENLHMTPTQTTLKGAD